MYLAGEHRQRALARTLLGNNLEAEAAPMSFPLKSGGEEIRATPLAYIPDLSGKVVSLLQQSVDRLIYITGFKPMYIPQYIYIDCNIPLTVVAPLCGTLVFCQMRSGSRSEVIRVAAHSK